MTLPCTPVVSPPCRGPRPPSQAAPSALPAALPSSPRRGPGPALPPPTLPAAPIALFLDVDGTLLDLAPRPDAVQVPAGLPAVLDTVRQGLDGALALLSGRALATLDRLFAPHGFAAAGLHGLERRDATGQLAAHAAPGPAMAALRAGMQGIHARHPGLLLEDKGGSLALHWRQSPDLAPVALEGVRTLARELGNGFTIQHGKQVVELRPAGADKGQALRCLMATPTFVGRLPLVFGDDLTDESAFQAAAALGGFGVIVGPRRPTAAGHALSGPAALRDWLAALPQQLRRRPAATAGPDGISAARLAGGRHG